LGLPVCLVYRAEAKGSLEGGGPMRITDDFATLYPLSNCQADRSAEQSYPKDA
jgi:hypothetical protein